MICKKFSAVLVATEETTADKGIHAGEGIDTSILTGDIMARIKVSFLLAIFWLVFPVVKYIFESNNIMFFASADIYG